MPVSVLGRVVFVIVLLGASFAVGYTVSGIGGSDDSRNIPAIDLDRPGPTPVSTPTTTVDETGPCDRSTDRPRSADISVPDAVLLAGIVDPGRDAAPVACNNITCDDIASDDITTRPTLLATTTACDSVAPTSATAVRRRRSRRRRRRRRR